MDEKSTQVFLFFFFYSFDFVQLQVPWKKDTLIDLNMAL